MPLLLLNSCSDEELPTELTGTTWEYKIGVENLETSLSYKFTSATTYTFSSSILGESAEYSGTYVYDSETGKVIFDQGEESEMTGTIKDNKLEVNILDMGSLSFKKK